MQSCPQAIQTQVAGVLTQVSTRVPSEVYAGSTCIVISHAGKAQAQEALQGTRAKEGRVKKRKKSLEVKPPFFKLNVKVTGYRSKDSIETGYIFL